MASRWHRHDEAGARVEGGGRGLVAKVLSELEGGELPLGAPALGDPLEVGIAVLEPPGRVVVDLVWGDALHAAAVAGPHEAKALGGRRQLVEHVLTLGVALVVGQQANRVHVQPRGGGGHGQHGIFVLEALDLARGRRGGGGGRERLLGGRELLLLVEVAAFKPDRAARGHERRAARERRKGCAAALRPQQQGVGVRVGQPVAIQLVRDRDAGPGRHRLHAVRRVSEEGSEAQRGGRRVGRLLGSTVGAPAVREGREVARGRARPVERLGLAAVVDGQGAAGVEGGQEKHERAKVCLRAGRVLVVREEAAVLIHVDLVQLGGDGTSIRHQLFAHLVQNVRRDDSIEPPGQHELIGHELVGLADSLVDNGLVAMTKG